MVPRADVLGSTPLAIAALVVVVLVTASEAQSAQTEAAARALEAALEQGSVVLVRAADASEKPNLQALGAAAHADAVAAVTWTERDGRRAHVEVQRVDTGSVTEREIEFQPSDANIERGRTIGFVIASMLPGSADAPPVGPTVPPPLREQPPKLRWSGDLAVVGTAGLAGRAGGVGGAIGLGHELSRSLDVRAVVAITRGELPEAQASLVMVRPRAGLGITVLARAPLAAVVRLEVGPWWHGVSRGGGTAPNDGGRWLFGGEAVVEVVWDLGARVALTGAAGIDAVAGETRVLVGGGERATIPTLRIVGDAGVRLRF